MLNMENDYLPMKSDYDMFENISYYYEYDLEEPSDVTDSHHFLHIISIVIYSVAFLLGVPGNAIVIWFTGIKWEKTFNTIWFLNLAVADLIFVLFLPFHITYVATNFHWPFGKLLCKLNSFITLINLFASVFFLSVIGLNRFLHLAFPSFSQKHFTLKKSVVISVIVWLSASIIACPSLFFRDTLIISKTKTVCFINFHDTDTSLRMRRHMILTLVRFLFGYFIPLITMIVCYTILTVKMKANKAIVSSNFFWTTFAVVVAFFVCWTPFHILMLLEIQVHHTNAIHDVLRIGVPLSTSLAFVNSCLNPILYVLTSKVFRVQFCTTMANIFKHTIQDISQTGTLSEHLMETENKPSFCETAT
ncbi:chemerin-like receptor 2 [Bombina bombina]|uniref:chemerin-like receptor 2 n=1 Tax=Bombina bombina TaxID=8345 RepID=UPI00235B1ADE|nr:chemerin-like receptor 2 [Bombina bombina]XP_053554620.1 chemerin-like receptor 2 [Bombina bombina]XP_053554621.1 chemerin-like receptor 2 [Bombina bombina]XP_053554622.1 chemerin-like receptor 2 [Bombina bombina]XP_053554623.1 chemerin-like receptor 2 [Bombina bombina]